jgi:hypothetical protein
MKAVCPDVRGRRALSKSAPPVGFDDIADMTDAGFANP